MLKKPLHQISVIISIRRKDMQVFIYVKNLPKYQDKISYNTVWKYATFSELVSSNVLVEIGK
jgi:hypothetical protein